MHTLNPKPARHPTAYAGGGRHRAAARLWASFARLQSLPDRQAWSLPSSYSRLAGHNSILYYPKPHDGIWDLDLWLPLGCLLAASWLPFAVLATLLANLLANLLAKPASNLLAKSLGQTSCGKSFWAASVSASLWPASWHDVSLPNPRMQAIASMTCPCLRFGQPRAQQPPHAKPKLQHGFAHACLFASLAHSNPQMQT